jgi:heterodisulfide reductase subunit B
MAKLDVELEELPRWNCCGAVYSLADDDLIHHVAPVRNLVRAQEQGSDQLITICSQCYNTLARANQLMREDPEKRKTLNLFMDEEPDYDGSVEVLHYLAFLRDHVGWAELKRRVKVPLAGLSIAPFYGCTLLRPDSVSVNGPSASLFEDFLTALGAAPAAFGAAQECCGSYQSLAHPEQAAQRAGDVLRAAQRSSADAIALSCPLCEYNLGTRQSLIRAQQADLTPIPTFYFTQLLGVALGLAPDLCHLELNGDEARQLLRDREYIAAVTA